IARVGAVKVVRERVAKGILVLRFEVSPVRHLVDVNPLNQVTRHITHVGNVYGQVFFEFALNAETVLVDAGDLIVQLNATGANREQQALPLQQRVHLTIEDIRLNLDRRVGDHRPEIAVEGRYSLFENAEAGPDGGLTVADGVVPVLQKFVAQTLAYVRGIKVREAHTDIDRQFAGYFDRILRKPFDRVGLRLVGQTRVGLAVRLEISDKRIGEVPTGV